MKSIKKNWVYIVTALFIGFLIYSKFASINAGIELTEIFIYYLGFILKVIPGVFLIVGLFNVWVKKETIIKHMGDESGFKGYILAILLSFASVGGTFAIFPVAHSLYLKGSKLSVVLTYMGAACVCRIPMTMFEITLLGIRFTIIRYLVSIPLIIISSIIIEKMSKHHLHTISKSAI